MLHGHDVEWQAWKREHAGAGVHPVYLSNSVAKVGISGRSSSFTSSA